MKEREISNIRINNIKIKRLFKKRNINCCVDEQITVLNEEKIKLKI